MSTIHRTPGARVPFETDDVRDLGVAAPDKFGMTSRHQRGGTRAYSDPTADHAIRNVDRERARKRERPQSNARWGAHRTVQDRLHTMSADDQLVALRAAISRGRL